MAAVASHSPLEQFLLFETINSYSDESPTFNTLSQCLKDHEALRERGNGEIGRFEPEALKELYLGVLHEQTALATLKAKGDTAAGNGAISGQLRSPIPETVDEASHHKHLLPDLLNRLYFSYRDHAIKEIQEEEQQYRNIKNDIEDLQRKERDARAQQDAPVRRDSRGVASIQHLLQHDPVEERPVQAENNDGVKSPRQQPEQEKPLDYSGEDKARSSIPNGNYVHTQMQSAPTVATKPTDSRPQPHGILQESPSFYASSQHPAGYGVHSPKTELNRRPTLPSNQSRPSLAPSPSPRLNQGPLSAPDRGPSNSPIILPPPPGMRHPGSSPGPLEALADMAGQQHRGRPPLPSPRSQQVPSSQHPPQFPQHHTYPPQPYSYYKGQQPYTSAYSSYSQTAASPYAHADHRAYPPYQQPIPSSASHPQYSNVPYPPYPQYSTYGQTAHYPHPQTPRPTTFGPPSYPSSAQHTPMASTGRPRPPRPSPIITSTSSTKWKNIPDASSSKTLGSPTRPSQAEISPISDRAPSSQNSPTASKGPDPPPTAPKRDKNPRRTAAKEEAARRGGIAALPKGRRGSTTSRPSTRSESIASPAANEDPSIMVTSQKAVKNEPPATPAADTADETASVLSTTADEAGGARKSTRKRRETLRGLESTEFIHKGAGTKRKRASTQGTSAEPPTSVPAYPLEISDSKSTRNPIVGARNFPRTSATIMNETTSHKLAGMFARPITEKEAPGYKNLVYRPQDLKSIKGAITAGNRALAAVDSSGENNVTVSPNPDVTPPKGIVNSAQLEKELMRMFANAVMFNPDPKRSFGPSFTKGEARHVPRRLDDREADEPDFDSEDGGETQREEEGGVVSDTREMYEAVEVSVENWRAAEDWVGVSGTPARGGAPRVEVPRRRGAEDTEADEAADEETPEAQTASPPPATGRRRRR